MNECGQKHPPSGDGGKTAAAGERVPGTPCTVTSPSRERETRVDSAKCLLEAVAEYERTVSLLLTTVLRLCLPGGEHGMGDAAGSHANRAEEGNRPNG